MCNVLNGQVTAKNMKFRFQDDDRQMLAGKINSPQTPTVKMQNNQSNEYYWKPMTEENAHTG